MSNVRMEKWKRILVYNLQTNYLVFAYNVL
jgi:hypothetical protein